MKTIILNQRKERDELMSRPYLTRRNHQDIGLLLNSRALNRLQDIVRQQINRYRNLHISTRFCKFV